MYRKGTTNSIYLNIYEISVIFDVAYIAKHIKINSKDKFILKCYFLLYIIKYAFYYALYYYMSIFIYYFIAYIV